MMEPSDGIAGTAKATSRRRPRATANSTHLRKALVENQMYATAMKLFARRGFAGTSLQDIADDMGVTRPALYYYVKSKDDLLTRLIAEITEANTVQIRGIADDEALDPVAKLSEISRVMALNRALHPSRFLLLERSEAALPPRLAAIHEATKRAMLGILVGVIRDGIDAGQFRPVNPRAAALQVIGMCNWIAWWFHEEDPASAETVASDIADLAVSGLIQSPERIGVATGPRAAAELMRRDLAYLEQLLDEAEHQAK